MASAGEMTPPTGGRNPSWARAAGVRKIDTTKMAMTMSVLMRPDRGISKPASYATLAFPAERGESLGRHGPQPVRAKAARSRRRQHGHHVDLVNRLRVGQRTHLDHGRGRHARRVEIFEPDIAHHAEVRLQVDEIMAQLYDMLEAAAGRAERTLDVEEGLLRLRPEIARRADDLVVDVAALLAGDIDDAPRPDRLDRVVEARILEAGRGIEKAHVSRPPLRQRLSGCTAEGGNDGCAGDETAAGRVVVG